jgi:hypothetical protein
VRAAGVTRKRRCGKQPYGYSRWQSESGGRSNSSQQTDAGEIEASTTVGVKFLKWRSDNRWHIGFCGNTADGWDFCECSYLRIAVAGIKQLVDRSSEVSCM